MLALGRSNCTNKHPQCFITGFIEISAKMLRVHPIAMHVLGLKNCSTCAAWNAVRHFKLLNVPLAHISA